MKLLYLQGALFVIIGALTPVMTTLGSDTPITQRTLALLVIGGIVSGATSLKAFLSTTFSDSAQNPSNHQLPPPAPPAPPPIP